jgi:hypothetical protein
MSSQQPQLGQSWQFQQSQCQESHQVQHHQPQQELPQQSQTGVVLKFVEYLFYILSAADFLLGTFGIVDLTGFKYSPIIFGVIGAAIGQYVKKKYGIVDEEN